MNLQCNITIIAIIIVVVVAYYVFICFLFWWCGMDKCMWKGGRGCFGYFWIDMRSTTTFSLSLSTRKSANIPQISPVISNYFQNNKMQLEMWSTTSIDAGFSFPIAEPLLIFHIPIHSPASAKTPEIEECIDTWRIWTKFVHRRHGVKYIALHRFPSARAFLWMSYYRRIWMTYLYECSLFTLWLRRVEVRGNWMHM